MNQTKDKSLNDYQKPVTFKNDILFTLPTIAMSLFMSFYTMVDGLFVSRLIGTNALSAINLTAPVISLVTAVSTMLATGGSAVIMKKMGEKKEKEARQDFTSLILVNVLVGLIMGTIGYFAMNMIFSNMKLSLEVMGYCRDYLGHYLIFTIPILLMNNFSLYLIASGKSSLSFICSVAGGIANIILDYVFIQILGMGIGGAAVATGMGYSVTTAVGFIVFSQRKNMLHFVKPVYRFSVLKKTVTNGCSEMATALVTGITTLIFNWTMLKYVGEDGVAAITIIMYVLMFVSSLFSGYSYGAAPMISYYYGAQNHLKLKKLVRLSLKIITGISISAALISLLITPAWYLMVSSPGRLPSWLDFLSSPEPAALSLLSQLLVVEFLIDVLKLASLNTPDTLSNSFSMLGALILGDFAVQAGWLGPEVLVYMAFVSVAGFAQPSYELGYAFKLLRVALLLLTAAFDVWGFCLGFVGILVLLATTKPLVGHGYLYPLIPFNGKALRRLLVREPINRDNT